MILFFIAICLCVYIFFVACEFYTSPSILWEKQLWPEKCFSLFNSYVFSIASFHYICFGVCFFFLYCLWHWFKQKIKQHLSNNFIKNANHNISFSLSLSLCFHLEQWDSYPFVSRILYLYGVIQMSTWMLIKSN